MGIKVPSPPRVESSCSSSLLGSSSSSSNATPVLPSAALPPVEKLLSVSSSSTSRMMKSKNNSSVAAAASTSTATTATAPAATDPQLEPCSATTATIAKMTMPQVAARSASRNETWIVIDGNVHNVTVFMERHHPGGDLVISNMRNQDCSLVFENYHFTKLTYARAMLRRYCPIVGTLSVSSLEGSSKNGKDKNNKQQQQQQQHVPCFRAIQQELYNTGFFQVDAAFYYKLYVWLVVLFASSVYLTLLKNSDDDDDDASSSTNFYSHMMGAVLMGCFWQQLAGLGHDLGHTNVSRNYQKDHWNSSIFGCTLSGISNAWWKKNHNTHHVVCNSIEHDPDIQHLPTFAVSPLVIQKPYYSSYYQKWFEFVFWNNNANDVDKSNDDDQNTVTDFAKVLANVEAAAARFMISNQHYFLIPIMLVARFNMYAQSWLFLLNTNNTTNFRKHEMVALTVFATWYSALALSLPTLAQTVAWVLTSHAVAGILHIQIIISHWAMETYRQDDNTDDMNDTKKKSNKKTKNDTDTTTAADAAIDDWYTLQLKTTMNIECPAWMDWFHFGLQYQVEHHLYPSLPRHSLRHASRLVRRACAEHDIPYHSDSFYGALVKTLRALQETAVVARQSGSCGKRNTTTKNLLVDALNCNG